MNLATAQHYAEKIQEWISPYAERVAVAGSIRRRRPHCNDVDLVVIPKITEHKDLLGEIISRDNQVAFFLTNYLDATQDARVISGAGADPEQISVQLPKVQLDIFFATERTWATRMLMRTGSKEHNIYLIERAKTLGLVWRPTLGVMSGTKFLHTEHEEDIFSALQLDYVPPERRER